MRKDRLRANAQLERYRRKGAKGAKKDEWQRTKNAGCGILLRASAIRFMPNFDFLCALRVFAVKGLNPDFGRNDGTT
jgi:hypothetical protein